MNANPNAHALVFSGHRIDAPGRKRPRFPPSKVDEVREELEREIDAIIAERGRNLFGIAGGAAGGDILFHEALVRRGIPTLVLLALPPEKFAAASVSDIGADWTERYYALLEQCPYEVLQEEEGEDLWVRNNFWILKRGLGLGAGNTTLLVLWDRKPGDSFGGTEDMVQQALRHGVDVVQLQTLAQ